MLVSALSRPRGGFRGDYLGLMTPALKKKKTNSEGGFTCGLHAGRETTVALALAFPFAEFVHN